MVIKDPKLRYEAMSALICYVFRKVKKIDGKGKQLKRLFKLVSFNNEFAKRCWRSHLWEDIDIKGSMLDDVFSWCLICNRIFSNCHLLWKHNVMFGYLTRARTEEILGVYEGSFLIRVSSERKLVLSTILNGKYIHVTIESSTEKELMKNIVPGLMRVICYDSTQLPVGNLKGLFRAEGVKY